MYDKDLSLEILRQIYDSVQTIQKRFQPIQSVEDFTKSDAFPRCSKAQVSFSVENHKNNHLYHKRASNMESIDQVLEEITKRLVEEFAPEQIFFFGSQVWGNPHQDSDLDLLVIVKNSELSPAKRASLAYRLLRDIPYPLDILVKTRKEVKKFSEVPAALEYQILHRGQLLYGG